MAAASGGYSAPSKSSVAVAGLPPFCRDKHFQKALRAYVLPLWDLPSGWTPEELKGLVVAPDVGNTKTTPTTEAKADEADEEATGPSDDAEPPKETGDTADGASSESDVSEVDWGKELPVSEGGNDTKNWRKASALGGLLLTRRLQEPGATCDYALCLSAGFFDREQMTEGGGTDLDKRLALLLSDRQPCWAVLTLRSGRFAGAVFAGSKPLCHKVLVRYTVRKGQGGSQSAADSGKTIKSVGSSLRRHGEVRLAEEIQELMTDKWAQQLASCSLVFTSVSKRMRSTLLGEGYKWVPAAKVRKIPFMVAKPTFEAVKDAHARLAGIIFAENQVAEGFEAPFKPKVEEVKEAKKVPKEAQEKTKEPELKKAEYNEAEDNLFSELHKGCRDGDEALVLKLLDEGADPTARDGKGRVPYYLCANQKVREAIRKWRGANEDLWDWTQAGVPEALTDEMEQRRKEKEKEKKKKQKEKQKANKAKDKEEAEVQRQKEEAEKAAIEAATSSCDCCKKKITCTPFRRLDFFYCSTDCVANHRRQLQAEAAMKRFGG
eukprot:gnl/MRDRNA2_/MRDRNA2_109231_c0_seq1.p1 gnl/MRDRNA2_/MRDRNA2_109231_c0~~gnl/MRDRNA2_/MRDRNA2_109231_c0_seq1.p1  ORF type:complete len:548 (+),score=161.02 gnl/MRDRNA2_/MRDRNA2_109231_c0_seq1:88-1731(+)